MKLISTNYLDVLNTCVTAVLVITEEGSIVLANKKACRMFAYDEHTLLELPVTALFEELQPIYECGHDEKWNGNGELKAFQKDGSEIFLKFFCVPYTADDGSKLAVLTLVHKAKAQHLPGLLKSFTGKVRSAQDLTNAVLQARAFERQEIGRELHDNVNQILASAILYIGLQRKVNEGAQTNLQKADLLIKKAIEELRTLSHSLVAPSLGKESFLKALEEIIETSVTGGAISIDKEITGFENMRVSEQLWLNVFRIIQEQFNNIIKYACADKVHLKLSHEKRALLLSIRDNGIGFNPAMVTTGAGLLNINSRASMNNGSASIRSSPGNGCELKVCFNL